MNKCSRMATIAQVAAHRLIAKALQISKQYVGLLLKTVKHTLFLTFSCAEYESHDIIAYLRTVNNVPDSYNGKLCTEVPVSVSRQFSNKFHAFYKKVLLKGNVLGIVSHYFCKLSNYSCWNASQEDTQTLESQRPQ